MTTCLELVQGLGPLYLFTGVSSITVPQMCQDINSICCEVQPCRCTQQNCKSIYKLLHINEGSGTNSRTSIKFYFIVRLSRWMYCTVYNLNKNWQIRICISAVTLRDFKKIFKINIDMNYARYLPRIFSHP